MKTKTKTNNQNDNSMGNDAFEFGIAELESWESIDNKVSEPSYTETPSSMASSSMASSSMASSSMASSSMTSTHSFFSAASDYSTSGDTTASSSSRSKRKQSSARFNDHAAAEEVQGRGKKSRLNQGNLVNDYQKLKQENTEMRNTIALLKELIESQKNMLHELIEIQNFALNQTLDTTLDINESSKLSFNSGDDDNLDELIEYLSETHQKSAGMF